LHPDADRLIDMALREDAAYNDITSRSIFSLGQTSTAQIIARADQVLCGLNVARRVITRFDSSNYVTLTAKDGDRVSSGTIVLQAEGPTISLLGAERTALNFLQHLSGIATLANRYAEAARKIGTGVRIVDTRKTTPGWRTLEKYAVRCGGCFNHRSSLGEHVLIKENHIAAAGSLQKAVQLTRAFAPHTAKIEVEAESLVEAGQAVDCGADVILLDNMPPDLIRECVALIGGKAIVEVSGGVHLDNLAEYALPGVDVISIGALTHSAPAGNFSMILGDRPGA
jgi:nicotinate-nucleotide pyrophosphorylase (carboxylating)